MCGRYSLEADIFALLEFYRLQEAQLEFRGQGEIFPTNPVPVFTGTGGLTSMDWGFLTSFSKRPLINARGETVHEKPTFRRAFQVSRCLLPASSFFEWRSEEGKKKKTKLEISLVDRNLFSMAGIYMTTQTNGRESFHCCIITTQANEQMQSIHDRMPVILPKSAEIEYLTGMSGLPGLQSLLQPSEEELRFRICD